MTTQIVGIAAGSIGNDPFDLRTWSGSSAFLFQTLRRRGHLARSFGADIPKSVRVMLLAKTFSPSRRLWRKKFYLDISYRESLTRAVAQRLVPSDYEHAILQIGTWFNLPVVLQGRARCFEYSDSNLVESLKASDFAHRPPEAKVKLAMAYDREVYLASKKVLCFSEYMRQSFLRDFHLPEQHVVTVGGGMNLDTLPERDPAKRYDTEEVLFIGIDFPRKGGPQVLQAFRAVASALPHAKLHIVGPAKLHIPEDLRSNVIHHGFITKSTSEGRAKLDALFRRSSLFVMPSLYEPFGIAPLEAMVHDIPCIVTNEWALKEMVRPGVNGDLVERGSVDDLADKIIRCLRDPDGLRKMGQAGRDIAVRNYTWDTVVDRILKTMDYPA